VKFSAGFDGTVRQQFVMPVPKKPIMMTAILALDNAGVLNPLWHSDASRQFMQHSVGL
jgi:hypothetical protein